MTSLLMGVALAWAMYQASHAFYQCEMTYMWPRYEPVDIGGDHGSRYRLLLYRDDSIPAHAKGAPSPEPRLQIITQRVCLELERR